MTEISEEFRRAIGQRLRRRRRELDLTAQQVAEEIGVTQATLSTAECGHTCPSAALLVRLAIRYRVRTDWILGLEG